MPNYCENDLTIEGEDVSQVLAFISNTEDKNEDASVFDFNKVIPYPQEFRELDEKAERFHQEMMDAKSKPEQKAIREKWGLGENEFFKDGYNSGGYEWCNENWDTKWNAIHPKISRNDKEIAVLNFDTAWSPPCTVIDQLAKKFPAYKFTLDFFEMGAGYKGQLYAENGETTVSYDNYDGDRGG